MEQGIGGRGPCRQHQHRPSSNANNITAGHQEVCVRSIILILAACVLTAYGSVQPEPGFSPQEVVRQVHARGDMTGSAPVRASSRRRHRVPSYPTFEGREFLPDGGPSLSDEGRFLLDTNSTLVPAPGHQTRPVVAFDGSNFLVVWEDQRGGGYVDICGARVTQSGKVIDTSGFFIAHAVDDQLNPAVGFDGTNFLVVWQDYRSGYAYHVYGARVTPGGAVLDPSGFIVAKSNNNQTCPAIEFDGTNYLVAWQDSRNDPAMPDIYGARVTSGGEVLDPAGFAVSLAARGQYAPAVGFDGTNYFVAWQDCRDSGTSHIYGARVTPQGAVFDTAGIFISPATGMQGTVALDFDGTNYFVAWQDIRGSFPPSLYIYGSRVTTAGDVLDRSGIRIASGQTGYPAIDFDGANFLVVWQSGSQTNINIYGSRISPAGQVLDAITISSAPGMQFFPAVCFDGSNSLVAWQDYRNNAGEPDIYAARVKPDGTVLDSTGLIITQAARDQYTPALGFDGVNFLVVWEDHRNGSPDIYGARVTPGGTVLDPDGLAIAQAVNDQTSPAITFDGANFLVVWRDCRTSPANPDIYGARVTPGGVVMDMAGFAICQAATPQGHPGIGFDGTNFLVVWEDHRSGAFTDLYGARVTRDATVLDPGGFAISQAPADQFFPDVGFDGANYLVVWEDHRGGNYSDIYGARVTSGGAVLEPDGIVISQASRDQLIPALAFDGANYLVVYEDYHRSIFSDIYGARVTPGGVVLDAGGFAIGSAVNDQWFPAVGFNGRNFLVVWEDYRSYRPVINGAFVTPGGVIRDTGVVLQQEGHQSYLALACGADSQMLLVYQGWAGIVQNRMYNTDRIWGAVNPLPGAIAEMPNAEVRTTRRGPTIVRGVLVLGAVDSRQNTGYRAELLDAAGRKVLDLLPGVNDVRALAPGVYFVREAQAQAQAQAVRKIVVTR